MSNIVDLITPVATPDLLQQPLIDTPLGNLSVFSVPDSAFEAALDALAGLSEPAKIVPSKVSAFQLCSGVGIKNPTPKRKLDFSETAVDEVKADSPSKVMRVASPLSVPTISVKEEPKPAVAPVLNHEPVVARKYIHSDIWQSDSSPQLTKTLIRFTKYHRNHIKSGKAVFLPACPLCQANNFCILSEQIPAQQGYEGEEDEFIDEEDIPAYLEKYCH